MAASVSRSSDSRSATKISCLSVLHSRGQAVGKYVPIEVLEPGLRRLLQRKHAGLTVESELLAHIQPRGWAHILLTSDHRWSKRL